LTDIHVVPNNPNEAALKQVVAEINQDEYDFVVITGFVQYGFRCGAPLREGHFG
jgi:hypothetical protein